jgi:hypothetical protein
MACFTFFFSRDRIKPNKKKGEIKPRKNEHSNTGMRDDEVSWGPKKEEKVLKVYCKARRRV